MIREDRELLVELARLNRDMASLGMRIMDGSASAGERVHYAQRLIAAGKALQRRVDGIYVIDGEVLTDEAIALPAHTVKPGRKEFEQLG